MAVGLNHVGGGRAEGPAKSEGPQPTMMVDNLVFCAGVNTQIKYTRCFKRNDIYLTRKKSTILLFSILWYLFFS